MAKDWQALYSQLGALASSLPDGLARPGPITPEMRIWMGRACAVVSQVGNGVDPIAITTACDNLDGAMRQGNAYKISSIVFRNLAIAESFAPASAQGAFIPVGHDFDAFTAISKIFAGAAKQILLVDPYMDEKALTVFAPLVPENISIQLLADAKDHKAGLLPAIAMWRNQYTTKRPLEARLAAAGLLHDRLIVVDRRDVWTLTQSLNAFATRSPATIARLDPETAGLKAIAFMDIWNSARTI